MIATQNQQAPNTSLSTSVIPESHIHSEKEIDTIKNLASSSQLFLPSRIITHHPKSGINPLVDAAGFLFTILGKLKQLSNYRQLNKLQKELVQEITTFQETIKNLNYNAEYIIVCRYAICATFDDIISNSIWGGQGQWDSFSLLTAFNQDTFHQEKFFSILERALKEPVLYIDLMELMYLCLSMGYKGQYRSTEHDHYQLEQITNNLYKHIRAYRGSFSKNLSPPPLKAVKANTKVISHKSVSPILVIAITACVVMTIFVTLGYLMDVISNEAYKNLTQIDTVSYETTTR